MPKRLAVLLLGMTVLATPAQAQSDQCPPSGMDQTKLLSLKAEKWVVADAQARDRLVIAITQCLGDADPVLRDDIAFEALSHYLRGQLVSKAALLRLADILQAQMRASDPDGFRRPFAALALSEVARADRIAPFLEPAQRQAILAIAIGFMRSIDDYRGFDTQSGYRHNVAHGADLMLQLALNPAFGKDELLGIRDALAVQIAPKGHSYITGESERLARPILFMAQRNLISEAEWTSWFAELAGSGEPGQWTDWFRNKDGIARKHNLMGFLSVLYVNVDLGGNPALETLKPGLVAAIKSLP